MLSMFVMPVLSIFLLPEKNRTEQYLIEDKLRSHAGGIKEHNTNRQIDT